MLMQSHQAVPAHLHQVRHSNIDEAVFPQKARPILRKTQTLAPADVVFKARIT